MNIERPVLPEQNISLKNLRLRFLQGQIPWDTYQIYERQLVTRFGSTSIAPKQSRNYENFELFTQSPVINKDNLALAEVRLQYLHGQIPWDTYQIYERQITIKFCESPQSDNTV